MAPVVASASDEATTAAAVSLTVAPSAMPSDSPAPASSVLAVVEPAALTSRGVSLVRAPSSVPVAGSPGHAAAATGLPRPRPSRGRSSGFLSGVSRVATDTREKALLGSVIRYIFYLSPPVVNKNLCTPALVIPFLASEMSWLAGLAPQGSRECIDGASREVFNNPLTGWLWLCDELSVGERGLYMTSRVKQEFQFIGHPPSLRCAEINAGVNPKGDSQWESRRLVVRSSLDLWNIDTSTPGSPSAAELAKLRQHLSTEEGARQAEAAGCVILPGTAGTNGPATDKATLVFGWGSIRWVPGSPSATLVGELSAGFFKTVNRTLATVKDWPVESPVASLPVGRMTGRNRKRSAPGAAFSGVASPRAPSAAETGQGPGQRVRGHAKKVATFNDVDAAASYVHAPPLADIPGCIISSVDPCPAWPRGGWGAQIPLASFLDMSAAGKVSLHTYVTAQSGGEENDVEVCSAGMYAYRLVVQQSRVQPTVETSALKRFVRAVPGVSERSRSIELLKGVRRVAIIKLTKDNRGVAQLLPDGLLFSQHAESGSLAVRGASPVAKSRLLAAPDGTTTVLGDVGTAEVGDADQRTTIGSSVAPSRAASTARTEDTSTEEARAVGMNADGGSSTWHVSNIAINVLNNVTIPSQVFSYSFSFRSDKLLRKKVTHVRDCGRLWVVADVKAVEPESPPTSA